MVNRIKRYTIASGYEEINTNLNNTYVCFNKQNNNTKVIMINNYANSNEQELEHINGVIKQIKDGFVVNGYRGVNCLSIVFISDSMVDYTSKLDSKELIVFVTESGKILMNCDATAKEKASEYTKELKEIHKIIKSEDDYYIDDSYSYERNTGIKRKRSSLPINNRRNYYGNNGILSYLKQGITHIVIINVVIFLVMDLLKIFVNEELYYEILGKGGCGWVYVAENKEVYRLITCMFLHSGVDHLFGNMLSLAIIGNYMEAVIGRWKLLFIYFSSGIIAGLVSISYNNIIGEYNTISVGASGAIFGLTGALVVILIFYRNRLGDVGIRRFAIYSMLSLYTGFSSEGIDNAAHVGGFFAGMIITAIMFSVLPKIRSKRNKKS